MKETLKNEIDKIDEIEIDKRLEKINPENIKLPLELKIMCMQHMILINYLKRLN